MCPCIHIILTIHRVSKYVNANECEVELLHNSASSPNLSEQFGHCLAYPHIGVVEVEETSDSGKSEDIDQGTHGLVKEGTVDVVKYNLFHTPVDKQDTQESQT